MDIMKNNTKKQSKAKATAQGTDSVRKSLFAYASLFLLAFTLILTAGLTWMVIDSLREAELRSLSYDVLCQDYDCLHNIYIGDTDRIRQILINLIGNAIKFTEEGSIKVQLSCIKNDDRRSILRFDIIDTGIGIPRDKQNTLFKEFTQVDSTIQRRFGGSGLGLTISKNLAALMDGHIDFESTEGHGSRFSFEVPLKISKKPTHKADVNTSNMQKQLEAETETISNSRILVAEDNMVNQEVARLMLEPLGISPHIVSNGVEALQTLQNHEFDIVFMDLEMPEMDGIEATRNIRKGLIKVLNPQIPIVAMTGHALNKIKRECEEAGVNDFITKPLIQADMRDMIIKYHNQNK